MNVIQELTLNEVLAILVFIAGIIGGVKYLKTELKDGLGKLLKDQFKAVNTRLDDVDSSINQLDIQVTKNFLVRYLSDVEREDIIYDTEKKRFWEEYDHYRNDLKENSYIKEWVERLKKEGKL